MHGIDVEKIGVQDLERGDFDEVFLLKLAEHSRDSDVLTSLAGHGNCIVRCAVAGNQYIDVVVAGVLEKDVDQGVSIALIKNPSYLLMRRGDVVDITHAVSRRAEGVNPDLGKK